MGNTRATKTAEPSAVTVLLGPPAQETAIELAAPAAAAASREEAQIKAAIWLARSAPRDLAKARTEIMRAVDVPDFAERAMYSFPRKGANIEDLSAPMARHIAACLGNMRCGLIVLDEDEDHEHIRGYAWDLESGNYREREDRFAKLIYRKDDGWIKPDERDLRELVNRRGAILVRNSILEIVPPDIKYEALQAVKAKLGAHAKKDLKADMKGTIGKIVVAFGRLGVHAEKLAEYLGHDLEHLTPEEVADLRAVHASIHDGWTKLQDHFPAGPEVGAVDLDAIEGADPPQRAPKGPSAEPKPAAAAPKTTVEAVQVTVTTPSEIEGDGPKPLVRRKPKPEAPPWVAVALDRFAQLIAMAREKHGEGAEGEVRRLLRSLRYDPDMLAKDELWSRIIFPKAQRAWGAA